jgi:uncharacterized protein YqfB (UPF0267 family)
MMIVSFAHTTPAFLANRKTRTRRDWVESHAKKFHVGDVVKAYDKSPRVHGKLVGYLRVTGLTRENVALMTEEDFEKEGFAYLQEQGILMWGKIPRAAFDDWIDTEQDYYVLDFVKIPTPPGEKEP